MIFSLISPHIKPKCHSTLMHNSITYLFNQQNTDNHGLDGLTWYDNSDFDTKTFMKWNAYTGSVISSPLTSETTFEMKIDGEIVVSKIVHEHVMFVPICHQVIPTGTLMRQFNKLLHTYQYYLLRISFSSCSIVLIFYRYRM